MTKILSTVLYAGRVLAIVEHAKDEKTYRTCFYRSTGSNVNGKDFWFPFCSIAGPGSMVRTGQHTGWIAKDLIQSTSEKVKIIPTLAISLADHSDIERRLTAFPSADFSVPEVAIDLYKIYDPDCMHTAYIEFPASPDDVKFINEWIQRYIIPEHMKR